MRVNEGGGDEGEARARVQERERKKVQGGMREIGRDGGGEGECVLA